MRTYGCAIAFVLLCSAPAVALDCAKAASLDEKAICSSSKLLKLDAELNQEFLALVKQNTAENKKHLKIAQRFWLLDGRNCDGNVDCLQSAIENRLRLLKGQSVEGPGTRSTMPLAAFADDAKDWALVEGPRFSFAKLPYQIVWNKLFDDAVAKRKANPTPLNEEDLGDSPDSNNYQTDVFSVSLATPQFLSGSHYSSEYFAGAAHPEWNEVAINLLVPSGKKLAFGDVIISEKTNALVEACASKSQTEGGVPDEELPALKSAVTDMEYWHFGAKNVSIKFPPFSVTSGYLQSISHCNFSAAELKPYLNSRFDIWPLP